MFLKFTKAMDIVLKLITILITVLLSIMTVVTVMEVMRRYLLGLSYPWAEELVRFMLVWVTFVGGAAALRSGNLVILDAILVKLSEKKRIILELFTNTVILGFLVFLFFKGVEYAVSPVILKQISPGLGIPMTVPYMAIPLGFALMILFSLEIYGNLILKLKMKKECL